MEVYKFGGASVKSAQGVKNVSRIIQDATADELLVVISAMGKTTNALEDIVFAFLKNENVSEKLQSLFQFHTELANDLLKDPKSTKSKIESCFAYIKEQLANDKEPDSLYDQIVSMGEIISTIIVADYLKTLVHATWVDARDYIVTNSTFREGKVNWAASNEKISTLTSSLKIGPVITQGFIGRDKKGLTTTLGRDGSDYTAAIFASCLNAKSVTIWKDVPGVMNADPKRLPAVTVFEELPFQEAAEMTYYGASVIHPKTIKPLANANIPLLVKNFDDPELPGTQIHECRLQHIPSLIVFKDNQCLVSCKVTDYTFITEDQLSSILKVVADHEVKINMMQNSAISFSFCSDYWENKIRPLIEILSKTFEVYYNTNLTLITIKNYSPEISNEYRKKPGILLEQTSRSTLQLLIRESASPSRVK